uniref:Protein IWS1 homolog (Trinotate prediction) n=1 Tax=Henneguya salminicola TaxID=69463 RepID=A0A6G3MFJ4_HENSL
MENDEELHSISSANSETKQDEEQEEDVNDKTNGLFADIFGESDEEDKFLEGSITQTEKVLPNEQFTSGQHFVSDFDMMMIQKKASSHRRQRKKDLDFQTEQDNKAAEIVQKMFNAVRSDRQKVEAGELAVEKLQLCTYLKTQLNRSGLYESFVENNVHHAIAVITLPF